MGLKEVDWIEYYNTVEGRPPRPTLLKALEFFDNPDEGLQAIDVGCGAGNDSFHLLLNGWKVIAIDAEVEALNTIKKRVEKESLINDTYLTTEQSRFEEIILDHCDLLNASYAIPFCHPNNFDELWNKIVNSIKRGGRFAGQIFGNRDEWVGTENMTFKTRKQVEQMFSDFEFESFIEEDADGTIANGDSKHWHVFHIVARKTN